MSGDGAVVDSEMSTSINSEASLDIDIVRHHDVATSTANLLEARDQDQSDTEEEEMEETEHQFGRHNKVGNTSLGSDQSAQLLQSNGMTGGVGSLDQTDDGFHAWLGVSWLIMYLMFVLFLLYKRKANVQTAVK